MRKYIYGPGIDFPVMMISVAGGTETKYYYFRDALGSVVALLNNSGSVVEAYSYDPFGKPKVHTAAGTDGKWLTSDDTIAGSPVSAYGNWQMFTGRQWDSESGLYYYRARMYSPAIGRFLQTDPIGYYDSMNLYQYCGNNPVNWIDPWGLCKGDQANITLRPPNFPLPNGWNPDWTWESTKDPISGGRWRDPKGNTYRPHPDPSGEHGGDHYDKNPPYRRGTDHKTKEPVAPPQPPRVPRFLPPIFLLPEFFLPSEYQQQRTADGRIIA